MDIIHRPSGLRRTCKQIKKGEGTQEEMETQKERVG